MRLTDWHLSACCEHEHMNPVNRFGWWDTSWPCAIWHVAMHTEHISWLIGHQNLLTDEGQSRTSDPAQVKHLCDTIGTFNSPYLAVGHTPSRTAKAYFVFGSRRSWISSSKNGKPTNCSFSTPCNSSQNFSDLNGSIAPKILLHVLAINSLYDCSAMDLQTDSLGCLKRKWANTHCNNVRFACRNKYHRRFLIPRATISNNSTIFRCAEWLCFRTNGKYLRDQLAVFWYCNGLGTWSWFLKHEDIPVLHRRKFFPRVCLATPMLLELRYSSNIPWLFLCFQCGLIYAAHVCQMQDYTRLK